MDPQTGWIVGIGITLYTVDGGRRWHKQPRAEVNLNGRYYSVYFLDAQTGWMITHHEIAHTTDGGFSWEVQYENLGGHDNPLGLGTIYFADRNEGWAFGIKGGIFHTTDGGQTWDIQEAPPGSHRSMMWSASYGGPHTLWAVGEDGVILKYTDPDLHLTPPSYWSVEPSGKDTLPWGGVKGQGQSSGTQLPIPTNGLLQNYPNPFNPETWIPYQLAQDGEVSIRIYGVRGQLVRELPLGTKQAGWYLDKRRAARWDGLDSTGHPVASGLYFYTLIAGDYTATRKLIVVR